MEGKKQPTRYVIDQPTLQMFVDVIQERPLKEVIHIYEAIKGLPVLKTADAAPAPDPEAAVPKAARNGRAKVPAVPKAPPAPELPDEMARELAGVDDEMAEFAKLSASGRAAGRRRGRRRH